MLLYIHGFNSSSQSEKAQVLKKWLAMQGREYEWRCPDLPDRPRDAIALLSAIVEAETLPLKLVGSSLGGFYANWLSAHYGLKAVLINPAVRPHLLLQELVGSRQTGWHDDFSYEFTAAHLQDLQDLHLDAPPEPDKLLVMLETGDETLDWEAAADYYHNANQLIFRGGNHYFTRFKDVLELIERF